MPAPDTEQTMAEYARTVLQDRAKELVSQFRTEADQLTSRTREQMETLINDVEDALAHGATAEEIRDILRHAGEAEQD
jgi:CHASE3 domain sensor protein